MSNAAGYAGALLELAQESGCADGVYEQCVALEQALAADGALLPFFTSPNLTTQERERGIDAALTDCEPLLRNTIKLLCVKGEGADLLLVLRSVRQQYQAARGILPAQVVTAVPLSAAAAAKLKAALCEQTGKTILLEQVVDPSVLGGVRVVMDGRQLDDTVQARLQAARELLGADLNLTAE